MKARAWIPSWPFLVALSVCNVAALAWFAWAVREIVRHYHR